MDADADFYWPEITIGNNLDAVRFAISNKNYLLFNCIPCIFSKPSGFLRVVKKKLTRCA